PLAPFAPPSSPCQGAATLVVGTAAWLRVTAPCELAAAGHARGRLLPLRVTAPCGLLPLRTATPCRGPGHSRLPLCRGALAATGSPLAGGRAMPYYPSSSLPSLRKRSKNA
ncbi:hypothetical protein BHM03_00027904, partial [Ensete ventricosum]